MRPFATELSLHAQPTVTPDGEEALESLSNRKRAGRYNSLCAALLPASGA